MLPDNVLLEIFDLCRKSLRYNILPAWKWHLLVHICQRWRQIVLESPHRLKLQILCTHRTPVRKNLCIWPAFPIVIDYRYSRRSTRPKGEGNVIAALEHPDRVSYVRLAVTGSQLGKMVTVMQKPFPVLTHLEISLYDGNVPVLPAEFLGGSAPRLQVIHLNAIPFPPLPTLSSLITLSLRNIPPTGYISPEAMVASLAALPRLENIIIEFQSATSRPDRIHLPPVTRSVLPALTFFEFNGASEYLEALVSRIDSPQLDRILIDYFNQLVDFQAAQLSKFIDRSVGSAITPSRHAHVTFSDDWVSFDMHRHANRPPWTWYPARTTISCEGIDWQVSHIAQVLSHFSTTLSNVVHLKLKAQSEGRQLEGTGDVEWLHLLHQFSTVQTLHVSQELAGHVALSLEDITGEMVAEVLPSLDLIYLAGQPASSIEKFSTLRQLSGRPVTIVNTEMEFGKRLESYFSE